MRHPSASDNSNAVSLFPFLAVLLCTMGALLVLLVVLAQRAGERAARAKSAPAQRIDAPEPAIPDDTAEVAALSAHLDKIRDYQRQLSQVRGEAEKRLRDEQQRLSHLEEHTRRLEHELARLSLAAQQLEATEKNQTVDRDQAERELATLQSLIQETEAQLEELREQAAGNRSYAVIPYQGPNGTYRKPIYIECRKDGVVLHPEGIRFVPSDFAVRSWPGNPLAAALRASREYLNAQAAKAGQPEPPDPYPLILVRPDGIRQYSLARAAINAWDADFGYEFIDGDWKLEFPEMADPQLARAQQHAVLIARERLSRLAQAAPRRFRGIGAGGGHGFGGAKESNGYGNGGASATADEAGALSISDGGSANSGKGSGGSSKQDLGEESVSASDSAEGEFQYGGMAGEGGEPSAAGDEYANDGGPDAASQAAQIAGGSQPSSSGGANQYGGPTSATERGGQPSGGGAESSTCASGSPSAGRSSGSSSTSASSAAGTPTAQLRNIAESRGRNWAVERGRRGAVPIRRTIHAVVRKDRLAILPSRHATSGVGATGAVVSLDQPTQQVADEFVDALRLRVDQWGLAGNGLYWRPVLKLNVGPDAQQTATALMRMLRDSGVEVSLPETAQGGPGNATR